MEILPIVPAHINVAPTHNQTVAIFEPKGPIRRVLEQDVLEDNVFAFTGVNQTRSVLFVPQKVDGPPPLAPISFFFNKEYEEILKRISMSWVNYF